MGLVAGGGAGAGAGIFPNREGPLARRFHDGRLFQQQQRADDHEAAVEKRFGGRQRLHAAVLDQIHEKCGHGVVAMVSEGQMGQLVAFTKFEQHLAPPSAAEETWRGLAVFRGMRPWPEVSGFRVQGNAQLAAEFERRLVRVVVESRVHMQRHDLKRERDDGLSQGQQFEHHQTVGPAGNGDADSGVRAGHVGLLHELAAFGEAIFLSVCEVSFDGHEHLPLAGAAACCERRFGRTLGSMPESNLTCKNSEDNVLALATVQALLLEPSP